MPNDGYIKLYRSLLDWEWYSDVNTTRLFLHLLLTVSHKDKKYKGKIIEQGSICTTVAQLSAGTGLTINEVRTAILHLKATQEVSVKVTNRESIFKVLNYAVYQTGESVKSQANHEQTTSKSQPINNLLTSVQNKNLRSKEIKKKNTLPEKSGECVKPDEVFNATYQLYPRKQGKAKGKLAYMHYLHGTKTTGGDKYRLNHQQIYIAVAAYAQEQEGQDPQYIQHFDTFMNNAVIDYAEKTRPDYEAFMAEKYGEEWGKNVFKYT